MSREQAVINTTKARGRLRNKLKQKFIIKYECSANQIKIIQYTIHKNKFS